MPEPATKSGAVSPQDNSLPSYEEIAAQNKELTAQNAQLLEQIHQMREEMQALRDEIAILKKQKPKPNRLYPEFPNFKSASCAVVERS